MAFAVETDGNRVGVGAGGQPITPHCWGLLKQEGI